jgi:pimeloyl-ACP methyl ester carboxylesterase
MLSLERRGSHGPLIVMLHWLGGSSRTFTEVAELLAPRGFQCVAIDLPGFGNSSQHQDFSIPAMVQALTDTIRELRGQNSADPEAPWLLAGHSMGGKLSMLLARAAEDNTIGLANLRGLVLLSPSTPSPEPMSEHQRQANIRDLGPATSDPVDRRKHTSTFVDDNTGKNPLLDPIRDRSIEDVLRMNPDALTAWMTTGSKLDCAEHIGILQIPALILAGTEEPQLNPDAQAKLTLPHIPHATIVPLQGSGHLSPLERPFEVADRMLTFFADLHLDTNRSTDPLTDSFSTLLHSDRTSPQTRNALLARLNETPTGAGVLDTEELRTLRAVAARIVPNAPFDLATRINESLAQTQHDGWRFNSLPDDASAWKLGLATLDDAALHQNSVPFIALHPEQQDELLHRAQAGDLSASLLTSLHLTHNSLTAAQMQVWFEDLRGECAKLYIADPRSMQRIGFTGFADNAGFTHITLEDNHLEPTNQPATSKEVTQ